MPSGHPIPAADRVPVPQKIAFALGINTDHMATGLLLGVLWMPYFNIGLGLSPAVLGLVLMVLRAWDAITDPLVGNWTDNTRTRWGRRRPFIFAGAILAALVYPLFWHIPSAFSDTGKTVWLAGVGMLFFGCYTLWSMGYYSLQLELTPNYDERTRLAAWTTFSGKLSVLAGGWIMAFATSARFVDPGTGRPDIVAGMHVCGWIIAAGIAIFGVLPALFVRERYYVAETSRQARDPFWKSIRESAGCRPLRSLIGASFFLIIGYGAVGGLGQYVSIYYVCHGDLATASLINGWKTTVVVVTGMLSVPILSWLGERFDKKRMVAAMLVGCIGGHLLNILFMTPEHPYWQIIPAVFEAGAIAAVWLFIPSMKADVADCDELHTGRRREGGLNAFYSWFNKVAHTLAMGLGGLLIELSGFSVKLAGQPPEVLARMRWLYIAAPILCWLLSLAFLRGYALTRERMADIRAQLEARRGRL